MPYDLVTPFGVRPGQVSPEEEFNQRGQQNDAARQAQLAAIQAQLAMAREANATQRYGIDTGLKQAGTFGERSAADMGMEKLRQGGALDVARVNMGPNQTYADLARSQYEEGHGLRDMRSQIQQRALAPYLNGSQGQGPMSEDQMLQMLLATSEPKDALGYMQQKSSIARQDQHEHQAHLDALAQALSSSQDPYQRKAGISLLTKAYGADLPPEVAAAMGHQSAESVIGSSPALGFDFQTGLKRAGALATDFGGQPEQVSGDVEGIVKSLVQKLVQQGVPEDEARAAVLQKLNEVVPQAPSRAGQAFKSAVQGPLWGAFSNDEARAGAIRGRLGF